MITGPRTERARAGDQGVLDHRDVGGEARHERRALKVVEVGEGELLQVRVLGLAQARAQAHGGAGREARVEKAQAQREERADEHSGAAPEDGGQAARHDAVVEDVGHEHGNEALERRLRGHAEHGHEEVAAIRAQVAGDEADAVHQASPPSAQAAGPASVAARQRLARARARRSAKAARSSGEKPASMTSCSSAQMASQESAVGATPLREGERLGAAVASGG